MMDRWNASSLLIVASVHEQERTVVEACTILRGWAARLEGTKSTFFFQVGYGQSLEEAFYALRLRGWLEEVRGDCRRYIASERGRRILDARLLDLDAALVVPLSELQAA